MSECGPSATSLDVCYSVAIGGKADEPAIPTFVMSQHYV